MHTPVVRPLPLLLVAACSSTAHTPGAFEIDRFSSRAGHLMVRKGHELPGPDQPIDFDHAPFVTQGLGPNGAVVRYYNFDVQSETPATLFRVVKPGTSEPTGQPDVVDVIPGAHGYSDFWRVAFVDAPATGTITSATQIPQGSARIQPTIINCPIVPEGSTARLGATPRTLSYRDHKLTCLELGDPLAADEAGHVPTSPIYVTFAGPAFRTEDGTPQTHNVLFSVPGDSDYSPLWAVHIYDVRAFSLVHDAESARRARIVKDGPLVNCPVVRSQ